MSKLPNLGVIIKQNGRAYPVVEEFFAVLLWNNSVSAQERFCDYFSMKFHLLDGMLRFLKHAPPWEI